MDDSHLRKKTKADGFPFWKQKSASLQSLGTERDKTGKKGTYYENKVKSLKNSDPNEWPAVVHYSADVRRKRPTLNNNVSGVIVL